MSPRTEDPEFWRRRRAQATAARSGGLAARVLGVALLVLAPLNPARAADVLVLHGIEHAAALRAPLQAVLERAGLPAPPRVRVREGALAHWLALREEDDALAALESAHFAAWRVLHRGWQVLAVSETTVAYSVVARRGITLVEADDLAGLRVAVPAPPSLPALQLLALFHDPLLAPRLEDVSDHRQGLALVRRGDVHAAVVPEARSRGLSDLRELLTLEEVPVAVLVLAPDTAPALAEALLAAVTGDEASPGLRALGLRPATLEAADNLLRRANLLSGTWGASP